MPHGGTGLWAPTTILALRHCTVGRSLSDINIAKAPIFRDYCGRLIRNAAAFTRYIESAIVVAIRPRNAEYASTTAAGASTCG